MCVSSCFQVRGTAEAAHPRLLHHASGMPPRLQRLADDSPGLLSGPLL